MWACRMECDLEQTYAAVLGCGKLYTFLWLCPFRISLQFENHFLNLKYWIYKSHQRELKDCHDLAVMIWRLPVGFLQHQAEWSTEKHHLHLISRVWSVHFDSSYFIYNCRIKKKGYHTQLQLFLHTNPQQIAVTTSIKDFPRTSESLKLVPVVRDVLDNISYCQQLGDHDEPNK